LPPECWIPMKGALPSTPKARLSLCAISNSMRVSIRSKRRYYLSCLTSRNSLRTLAVMRRGFFICVVVAALMGAHAPVAPADTSLPGEVATSAACNSVRYEGRTYVLYRRAVGCRSARRKVRYVHRHKRLPGWRCQSGSNFETGGGCSRGRKLFGWHPLD
jgi:hypothetical protein